MVDYVYKTVASIKSYRHSDTDLVHFFAFLNDHLRNIKN